MGAHKECKLTKEVDGSMTTVFNNCQKILDMSQEKAIAKANEQRKWTKKRRQNMNVYINENNEESSSQEAAVAE